MIYSLGYGSWKSLNELVKFLKRYRLDILDVRRFLTSKNPDFTKESPETNLHKHGVRYECMSDTLRVIGKAVTNSIQKPKSLKRE